MTATGTEIATLSQLLMLEEERYYKAGDTITLENETVPLGGLTLTDDKDNVATLSFNLTLEKKIPEDLTITVPDPWYVNPQSFYTNASGAATWGSNVYSVDTSTVEVNRIEGTQEITIKLTNTASTKDVQWLTGMVWLNIQLLTIKFS